MFEMELFKKFHYRHGPEVFHRKKRVKTDLHHNAVIYKNPRKK